MALRPFPAPPRLGWLFGSVIAIYFEKLAKLFLKNLNSSSSVSAYFVKLVVLCLQVKHEGCLFTVMSSICSFNFIKVI